MSKVYGSRSQVATLVGKIDDALGNKDGIIGNEKAKAGSTDGQSFLDRNPILNRVKAFAETGLRSSDEEARIRGFISGQEKSWGQPVSTLPKGAIADYEKFKAEKAIALVRFDRRPEQVVDAIVPARGSVDGQQIAPRDLFVQRWKPTAEPSGKVIVVSPGFLQTGRNFYEQIDLLNRQGHEVVVMDHQWAGLSSGQKGGIDRGFGIARDVAAVTAWASSELEGEVVILGTSMGAGAGALSAITLNDAGLVDLEGAEMPKGVSAVLQAPFFSRSPTLLNKGLAALGKVPVLKDLPLPAIGAPIISRDDATNSKLADHVVMGDVTARGQAFHASEADLGRVQELLESGQRPSGRVYFLHASRDPLADVTSSRAMAELLGDRAHFEVFDSGNHVFEETGGEREKVLGALEWLSR